MMRLQIFSDIHSEFHGDLGTQFLALLRPETVDVLIIAGDLGTLQTVPSMLSSLAKLYKSSKILYVLGNHEFYGSSIPNTLSVMRDIVKRHENITLLHNDIIEINGIMFVGTTLWFRKNDDCWKYKSQIADFSMISGFVPAVFNENKDAIRFLQWHVNGQAIVITHHMPTPKSSPERYKNDPLNRFFTCTMEGMIIERQPKMWIHGHTHDSCNYLLGKTHIVCNPLGYVGQTPNREFMANMMLDL